jgi:membrane protein implicated in regulation of membrane protease activity
MPEWAFWIIFALAMLGVEATTGAFVAIYFAVAAIDVVGVPLAGQLAAFAAVSVLGLVLTRNTLARLAQRGPELRTGVDAMRGQIGVVTKAIDEFEPGQVRVGGDLWTARSFYEHEPIPVGRRVEVVEVRGVTALVIEAPSPRSDLSLEEARP